MLKTIWSAKSLSLWIAEDDDVDSIGGDGNHEDKMVERSLFTSKNLNTAIGYLTLDAKRAFTQLSQAFTIAPIFQHFDSECHIRIETNASNYAINGILSQLTLDNLG